MPVTFRLPNKMCILSDQNTQYMKVVSSHVPWLAFLLEVELSLLACLCSSFPRAIFPVIRAFWLWSNLPVGVDLRRDRSMWHFSTDKETYIQPDGQIQTHLIAPSYFLILSAYSEARSIIQL